MTSIALYFKECTLHGGGGAFVRMNTMPGRNKIRAVKQSELADIWESSVPAGQS